MKRLFLSLSFLFVLCVSVMAQDLKEKDRVLKELNLLSEKYKSASNLSFDITYRYSDEKSPEAYLDSLQGSFKLQGKNYWYRLDSTEGVRSEQYALMVFKEDQLLYISKPQVADGISAPMAMIDSSFKEVERCSLSEAKGSKIITLDFTAASPRKRIEYFINAKTGLLSKLRCVLPADQLYDPSVRNLVESSSNVLLEIELRNYSDSPLDSRLFDPASYFKKEGNQFTAVAPFQTYKVFLGSPNL